MANVMWAAVAACISASVMVLVCPVLARGVQHPCMSVQQACSRRSLTCANEAIANEARLAVACAAAATLGAGGISAAASVVDGARVHG